MRYPRLLGLSLLIALSGCAGVSQNEYAQYRHYVAEKVPPGIAIEQAFQILGQDGYRCMKDGTGRAECDRSEDGLLRFCRYSVLMNMDTKRKTVHKTLWDIHCVKKYFRGLGGLHANSDLWR